MTQNLLVNRLGDLELALYDEVHIVYLRFAFLVDDFATPELHFLHVVIDLGYHVGSQSGKNAIIAQLLHNLLHFATVFLANDDAEVVSCQVGKACLHGADDCGTAPLVILHRQVTEVLASFQSVNRLEPDHFYSVLVLRIQKLKDLLVHFGAAKSDLSVDGLESLIRVKVTMLINIDVAPSQLPIENVQGLLAAWDVFPMYSMEVHNDEADETFRCG